MSIDSDKKNDEDSTAPATFALVLASLKVEAKARLSPQAMVKASLKMRVLPKAMVRVLLKVLVSTSVKVL
jgi:hypothetical protein